MKFGALPPSKRFWSSPATRATVIEFPDRLLSDHRAPPAPGQGAEIIDFTVYRLLRAYRGTQPSSRL